MAIDAEIVNFNDLDLVDNPSDTSELLVKTSDGIVKRVTKAELFEDEAAARTARDAELQNQIYTLAGAGSTEGSFRVVEKLDASLKGAANGVAELDSDGKVPSSQLPSFVDDVIEGYYNEADGDFYLHYTPSTVTHDIWYDGTDFLNSDLTVGTEPSGTAGTSVSLGNIRFNNDTPYMKDSDNWFEVTGLTSSAITVSDTAESDADVIAALEEAEDVAISYIPYEETVGGYSDKVTPEAGKVYVDIRTNITYRWSGSQYTKIGSDLSLGETSSTAYRGDRGKIAYDHSQVVGTGTVTNVNPHGLSKADIGLGNVPNVTTDNQTPTFSASSINQELESGETLSTLFGKLKKVVKSFIDHINTTISTNPHSTTKADVGLSDVINTGDSAVPVSGGTTKFTTGGAYTELEKKQDKNLTTPIVVDGTSTTTVEGALTTLADKVVEEVKIVTTLPVSPDIETRIYKYNGRYYIGDATGQTLTELSLSTDIPEVVSYVNTLPVSPNINDIIYAIPKTGGGYKFYAGNNSCQTTQELGGVGICEVCCGALSTLNATASCTSSATRAEMVILTCNCDQPSGQGLPVQTASIGLCSEPYYSGVNISAGHEIAIISDCCINISSPNMQANGNNIAFSGNNASFNGRSASLSATGGENGSFGYICADASNRCCITTGIMSRYIDGYYNCIDSSISLVSCNYGGIITTCADVSAHHVNINGGGSCINACAGEVDITATYIKLCGTVNLQCSCINCSTITNSTLCNINSCNFCACCLCVCYLTFI